MNAKIVVDMNLSPEWVDELTSRGWSAVHWSAIGKTTDDDSVIMEWARQNAHLVFTHDLDFGTALALTHANGPSILQIRGPAVLPEDIGPAVVAALRQHKAELLAGALVVVELKKTRIRVLPL